MTVPMAISTRTRGMKKAIGTDNHLVNKWGNAPSVKKAEMSAILGRKRLRTRNHIGSVVILREYVIITLNGEIS